MNQSIFKSNYLCICEHLIKLVITQFNDVIDAIANHLVMKAKLLACLNQILCTLDM